MTAAASTAGDVAHAAAGTPSAPADRPVGVGLVGLGAAGRQHAAALAESGCAELRAVCDTEPALRDRFVAGLDQAPSRVRTLDWETLMADPEVEAVALCTPPGSHLDLAVEALAAGKAVLLEKPPLMSEADLDRVLDAAERAARPVGVMLQHRFRLPDPVIDGSWSRNALAVVEVVRHRPDRHYLQRPWRLDPAVAGGGLFAHLAVHYCDLACQLLGEPATVEGIVDCDRAAGVDSRLALSVRFAGGARLTVAGTTGVDARGERLAVYDDGRFFALHDGAAEFRDQTGTAQWAAAPTPVLRGAVYAEFCGAVRAGTPLRRTALARSRGVVRMLERVRSLAS
jgi:predicted dehydrogenase